MVKPGALTVKIVGHVPPICRVSIDFSVRQHIERQALGKVQCGEGIRIRITGQGRQRDSTRISRRDTVLTWRRALRVREGVNFPVPHGDKANICLCIHVEVDLLEFDASGRVLNLEVGAIVANADGSHIGSAARKQGKALFGNTYGTGPGRRGRGGLY